MGQGVPVVPLEMSVYSTKEATFCGKHVLASCVGKLLKRDLMVLLRNL